MEGVMMRGETGAVAMAVRESGGNIVMETERLEVKKGFRKLPFVRGIFNLIDSLKNGMGYTMKSANIAFIDDEEEVSEKEMKIATLVGAFFGILLAVALFIFLPDFIARVILNLCYGQVSGGAFGEVWASLTSNAFIEGNTGVLLLSNLIKGLIKIVIFVTYLALVTKMKEIKRTFMYHGAEHKTINCFESEMPLTVENVQKCSTYHDRCGTAFMVFVILVSILVISVVEILINDLTVKIEQEWLKTIVRVLIRIVCLIPVASLSYELLMFNSKHDWIILRPLKWIGRGMQKLSTRQPDDGMVEIAIAAFNEAYAMDKDPNRPLVKFTTVGEFKEKSIKMLKDAGIDDDASVEWLLVDVLGVKRSQLNDKSYIATDKLPRLEESISRMAKGEPLQYILGNQQFFEFEFDVTHDVLIPRPETEQLVQLALDEISVRNTGDNAVVSVLDMCTGSGCIGITVAKKANTAVTLADVSEKALAVASGNARKLDAQVKTVKTDMFTKIEGKFDMILSNPPYVTEEEMRSLDANVMKEPMLALYGGKDGLDFYRIIAREAKNHLNAGGCVLVETGIHQGEAVKALFEENGMQAEIFSDLEGIGRFVKAC